MQVVRRRAVPREVGPPPGGPALVHTQIPVVFFTQAGVPGEAADMGASSQGLAAVCTQAMDHLGWTPLPSPALTLVPLILLAIHLPICPTCACLDFACDDFACPTLLARLCLPCLAIAVVVLDVATGCCLGLCYAIAELSCGRI